MPRRRGEPIVKRTLVGTLTVLLLVGAMFAIPASADPAKTGYPNSMSATGDSITRAFNTCFFPFTDCTQNSWATGTNTTVNSVYKRILANNGLISGKNFNDAKSGAKMVDLGGQVTTANGRAVELITVLMGANDVCTSSESSMTAVSTFASQFQQAMNTASAGSPNARISIGSIPNIYNLWNILHTNSSAVSTWGLYGICQSMLVNPTSTAQVDVDRRARVQQRNIDFNTQLAQICAQYIHCRFDNNAAYNLQFATSDVSTRDYFHPAIAGQAKAASTAWGATFNFTDNIAPASNATTSPVTGGLSVSITATDNVGVSGIEYKIGTGGYVRYSVPVTVPTGSTITYRAVDVNGNNEATHSITA